MGLVYNLLITLAVELSVMLLFYKKKRRKNALIVGLLLNLFSWTMLCLIIFLTNINFLYLLPLAIVFEWLGYGFLTSIHLKKAFYMAVFINLLSYGATRKVAITQESFQFNIEPKLKKVKDYKPG